MIDYSEIMIEMEKRMRTVEKLLTQRKYYEAHLVAAELNQLSFNLGGWCWKHMDEEAK